MKQEDIVSIPTGVLPTKIFFCLFVKLENKSLQILTKTSVSFYFASLVRTLYMTCVTSCISSACTESKLNKNIELMTFAVT